MELNKTEPKIKMTLATHPFYFGHYLNMARHNAYLILVHLSEKHNFEYPIDKDNEEPDWGLFKILNFYRLKAERPDELMAIKEDLLMHFPLLRCIKKESDFNANSKHKKPKNKNAPVFEKASIYGKVLREFLSCLNDLRNRYNHSWYEKPWTRDIDLNLVYNSAITQAQRRMGSFMTEGDFTHLYFEKGKAFNYFLKERDYTSFTEKGVIFFTNLFLEKKYAFRYLSRLEHFHYTETKWARATLETFTEHCCKLPKERLLSSDVKLDMLNELNRCPGKLYFLLSDDDQKKFEQELVINKTEIEEEEWKKTISMRRHSDRFPWFALNYFAQSGTIPELQFQVKLGKVLTQDIYLKEITHEARDRRILKPINSLGTPANYATEAAPGHWYNIKMASEPNGQKKATKMGEIDQYSPQYRVVGNRVGITIDPDFIAPNWPKLEKVKNTKGKDVCKVDNSEPTAILSTYELQNLFVYAWLNGVEKKIEKSAAQFIADYITNFKRFYTELSSGIIKPVSDELIFKEPNRNKESADWEDRKSKLEQLLKPYGLQDSFLPDDLKNYLLGICEFEKKEKVLQKINTMLKTTKKYLSIIAKMIGKEPMEKGERIPTGEMAQLLARDMVFLTPLNKQENNKPNNLQYSVLQNSLAFFSMNRDKLPSLFIELGFTNQKLNTQHPFLKDIKLTDCRGILDFFNAYYLAKVKFLELLKTDLKSENFKVHYKENKHLFDVEKNSALKKQYSGALMLPRGMFNKAIAKALELDEHQSINYYLNHLNGFGEYTQPFYSLKRYYLNQLDEEYPHLKETGNPQKLIEQINEELSIEDDTAEKKKLITLKKEIYNIEKSLRYCQSTDRVMWLMVYHLFSGANKEGDDQSAKLKLELTELNKIGFDQKSVLFEKEYPFEYILENKVAKKHLMVTETMQIKRYGDFRRFFKDRRLKDLLLYFKEDVIERQRLVDEIDDYENKREELLQKIYHFEMLLNKNHMESIEVIEENKARFRIHRSYLEFAQEHYHLDTEVKWIQSEEFRYLRNKIMHNQIPVTDWLIEEVKKGDNQTTYTSRILNLIGNTYDKMIEVIEKEETV